MYLGADSINCPEGYKLKYPAEMLNSIPGTASLPDHRVSLKTCYILMLPRNVHSKGGHANRARNIVEPMKDNLLFLHVETGSYIEDRLTHSLIPFNPGDDDFPIKSSRRTQFLKKVDLRRLQIWQKANNYLEHSVWIFDMKASSTVSCTSHYRLPPTR